MSGYHRSPEKQTVLNPEINYAQSLYARVLARLMDHNLVALDDELWRFCGWLLADLRERFRLMSPEVEKELTPALKKKWRQDTAWCNRIKFARRPDELELLLEAYEPAGEAIYEMLHQALREKSARINPPVNFRRAAASLRGLLGLDETAAELCALLYLQESYDQIGRYSEGHLGLFKFSGLPGLAKVLAKPVSRLLAAIDALKDLDILDGNNQKLGLDYGFQRLWQLPKDKDPQDLFCRPLTGETLALESYPLPPADLAYLKELLSPNSSSSPIHILLYGPPGTGKTSFARSLAEYLEVKAWNVLNKDNNNRRESLMAAVNIARRHQGALVVVDEAERVLNDTGLSQSRRSRNESESPAFLSVSQDKSWINSFMDEPGRRVIWIVNDVENLHPAIRRRFSFSLHFEKLGLKERRNLWRNILAKHRAEELLTDESLEHLVKEYNLLPAAVIDQVVRQGQALAEPGGPSFGENVLKAVKSYERLMNDGRQRNSKPRPASRYTLEGVSLEGSAEELLFKLKRLDQLRRSEAEMAPGFGTLLFYGPPGTGKTALARHLAEQLEKELLIKRASDLFGPYVGETEQNIAAAFREAEREDAVLVIDEADSFLYAREIAQRSWESSFVNEFLTALEECRCFFVATCNRREALDPAAMRRFSFKVAFTYAGPQQTAALYAQYLAPLTDEPLTAEISARLAALSRLTPGDFQAVRSRNQVFLDEKPCHDHLLRELAQEEELKLEKEERRIGFSL